MKCPESIEFNSLTIVLGRDTRVSGSHLVLYEPCWSRRSYSMCILFAGQCSSSFIGVHDSAA